MCIKRKIKQSLKLLRQWHSKLQHFSQIKLLSLTLQLIEVRVVDVIVERVFLTAVFC